MRKNCYLCSVNRIILHISYLLTHHDCVVVPGLGAFLNHYREAWIDEKTFVFHAPSVSVGFNPEIDYNDWMLADSISRREEISRESAMRIVTEEVKSMRYQLESDREISLGELGILRFNGGSTPEFIADPDKADSAFAGLRDINLNDTDEVVSIGEHMAPARNRHPLITGFLRVAACFAAILMAATLFLHISGDDNRSDVHFASIDSGLSAYALADALWGNNPPATPELVIAGVVEKQTEVEVKHVINASSREITRINGDDPYLVIVGSFASAEQAETFMSRHGDYNLGLMTTDGNYRVYAASARSIQAALEAADSPLFKERFAQSWVLKQ